MFRRGVQSAAPAAQAPRFGFVLVGFCFALGFVGRGAAESFTVFLLPLQNEFGSDRASIAGIYSVSMLAAGLSAPLVGWLFDRFGPLRLYLAGILALAAGAVLAAEARALWHFYLAIGLCGGFGAAAIGNVPNGALLSRWFRARLASAMSVVFSALGIGTLVMVPLSQAIVDAHGWRSAYRMLAMVIVALVLPLMLIPWRRAALGHPDMMPERTESAAEDYRPWTLMSAARTPAFWGFFSVFLFTSNGMFSFTVQTVAYLVEIGFEPMLAASAYGLVGILIPVGMIGFAWADHHIGRHSSMALSFGMSLCAIVALWLLTYWHSILLLGLFVLLLGLTFGSRAPLVNAMAARTFRGRNLGGILGSIMLGGGIGGAIGSFTGGYLHDLTGGYDAVLAYAFVSLLLGAAPFWSVKALARA